MTKTDLFRNLVIWGLEIIWNLRFEYWDFPAKAGFDSGNDGLGIKENEATNSPTR
jgi:hypothetical protein